MNQFPINTSNTSNKRPLPPFTNERPIQPPTKKPRFDEQFDNNEQFNEFEECLFDSHDSLNNPDNTNFFDNFDITSGFNDQENYSVSENREIFSRNVVNAPNSPTLSINQTEQSNTPCANFIKNSNAIQTIASNPPYIIPSQKSIPQFITKEPIESQSNKNRFDEPFDEFEKSLLDSTDSLNFDPTTDYPNFFDIASGFSDSEIHSGSENNKFFSRDVESIIPNSPTPNNDEPEQYDIQCSNFIKNSDGIGAINIGKRALELANITSNQKAEIYNKLCIAYLVLMKDPQNAERCAQMGIHFASLEADSNLLFKLLNGLCEVYLTSLDLKKAIATATHAMALPNISQTQIAIICNKLCIICLSANRSPEAEQFARIGLNFPLSEPNNDPLLLFPLWKNLSKSCLNQNKYAAAIEAARSGLKTKGITNDQSVELTNLGSSATSSLCEQEISNHDYTKALEIIKETPLLTNPEKIKFCDRLFTAHINQKQIVESQKIAEFVILLPNLAKNDLIKFRYYLSLSHYYQGSYQTAIEIARWSLHLPSLTKTEIATALNFKILIVNNIFESYINLAHYHYSNGNYSEAIKVTSNGINSPDFTPEHKSSLSRIKKDSEQSFQQITTFIQLQSLKLPTPIQLPTPTTAQEQPSRAPQPKHTPVLSQPEKNAQYYLNLCYTHFKSGNNSDGITALQQGLALPNISSEDRFKLFQAMAQSKNISKK